MYSPPVPTARSRPAVEEPVARGAGAVRPGLLAASGLAALVVLAYHRVLFLGETLVASDALTFTLPSRAFLGGSLRAGRFPQWADWIAFGSPFAANPIHGVTYPPLWLTGALPPLLASDLVNVAHLLVAAVGASLFASRLGAGALGCFAAGALYAIGGYAVTVVPNGMAIALAWLPWIAWAADRLAADPGPRVAPRVVGLAMAIALQAMAGEPGQLATAGLVAALVTLVRAERPGRAMGRLALAGAVAVPLSAAVLLPGWGLLGWSDRATGMGDLAPSVWALHPLRLAELVWPEVLGARNVPFLDLGRLLASTSHGAVSSASWSRSLFLGAPALLLAARAGLAGRRERWLLLGSLLFVLLALGGATPVYAAFRWLPPFSLARYPEKYVDGALLIWSALAGAGLTGAFREGAGRRPLLLVAAVASGALAALVAAGWLLRGPLVEALRESARASRFPYEVERAVAVSLRSGLVAAAAAALFAVGLALRSRRAGAAVSALALVGALLWHSQAMIRSAPRAPLSAPPGILGPLARDPFADPGPRPRLAVLRGTEQAPKAMYESPAAFASVLHEHLFNDVAARFGLDVVPGFDSVSSAPFGRLRALLEEARAPMTAPGLARLAGVECALVFVGDAPASGLPVLARRGYVALLAAPARPRAFVAPRWAWTAPEAALRLDEEALAGSGPPDPALVHLEGAGTDGAGPDRAAEPLAPCEIRAPTPEEVHLRCDSRLGGYAVLLDAPAPGWSARVDGTPARIEAADGLFRAVPVGPGPHEVTFRYRTPGLLLGSAVAIPSWLACLAFAFAAGRRRWPEAP